MRFASFLPTAFRWVFTVLEVLAGLAAVGIAIAILVDPNLPPGAHFGPGGSLQPAPAGQGEPVLSMRAFNGNVTVAVNKPAGLITVLKQYGFPLLLIYALFFAALFDLLRRLFRNVGRGESFTPQNVGLVQIVGGSLVIFALITTIGETWFVQAAFSYLMQHTDIAVSGTPVRLPQPTQPIRIGHWLPFGRAAFWCGLLVLALAEVFRQGLTLKRDNELTV